MRRYVCLLRGINVGGRNRVPMKPLRSALEKAGLRQVRSYLQSGNLVFDSALAQRSLGSTIQAIIESSCGFCPTVVLRTSTAFKQLAEVHPFAGASDDWTKLQVAFLSARPSPAALRDLQMPPTAREQYVCAGAELYLYYPDGLARTKVTGQFWETRLQQACTMRNWKTVQALVGLLENT